ncbi:MAG: nucleotidyltransferase family protein [Anaerolineae bacterium]|nr:nucleotidyltransferase family protein [Anaerolineae bacterium]
MNRTPITAIILAAGLSSRMGRPKPLLPFGERLVIERILTALHQCPVAETVVVVGHAHGLVEQRLQGWPNTRAAFNPDYATGEMLSSLQTGLQAVSPTADAALVALVDQPRLEPGVVASLVEAYQAGQGGVIVPSYQMRRGHPMLIDRRHWPAILSLVEGQSLRDFMRAAAASIYHVTVDTPSILRDMDTPTDYERELADYLVGQPLRETA